MAEAPRSECPSLMELELALNGAAREGHIAQHLEGCPDCRAALEEIRANNALMAKLAGSRLGLADVPRAGEPIRSGPWPASIEGYEILGEIHRGGQGVVYRAVQLATNRTVALKVLLAGTFATSSQRRRFEREIELVAHLEHPDIVTVYDSGTTRDGCHYLAMQYVEGDPLDSWIRRRQAAASRQPAPTLRERLGLFVKLCDGVSHAHQHGIIHRDLKPANVIVDAADEPHILDFGLAKPIDDAEYRSRAAVTQEGSFLGTLAYAAPEQTRGTPSLIDVRSDVYALGVMLYELLTRRLPYAINGELADALKAIASAAPQPLRVRGRQRGRAAAGAVKVDNELETIVLKALAKEKERRYQSAAALRDDLKRYLAGQPIEAKRDSGWYIVRKTAARYWLPASIAAAFVVLLIGFSATVSVMYRRARIEASKVRQINMFLEDTLSSVQPAQGGGAVTVRDLLGGAVQWIDVALADQPEVAASIQTTIGNSYRSLGRLEEAERLLQAALDTRRRLFGEQHKQVAQSINLLARLRHDQGRLAEAEQLYRQALAMQHRLTGDDRLDLYTLANFARLRCDQHDYEEAERLLNHSLAIRRRLFGEVHADVAMCLYQLAKVAECKGDLEQAEQRHRAALETWRTVLHRQHPSLGTSLYALGTLLLRTERPVEAELLLRECLTLRRETLRPEHWHIAQTQGALGAALAALGEYQEAEALLLESHARLTRAFGEGDPRTQESLDWLVHLYELCDRPETAESYRRQLP